MTPNLGEVIDALESRARSDSRLDRYRVPGGGPEALVGIPAGWHVSDAIEHIAVHGGWWPGEWTFPTDDNIVNLVLAGELDAPAAATIRWLGVGCVWQRDGFWTPATRERFTAAPLFGFSNQALWASMVFPTEAALLEAFLITYDELGLDESGEINPFFVEWVTDSPRADEPVRAHHVHERLRARSTHWTVIHPCWQASRMPMMGPMGPDLWPVSVRAALVGTKLD